MYGLFYLVIKVVLILWPIYNYINFVVRSYVFFKMFGKIFKISFWKLLRSLLNVVCFIISVAMFSCLLLNYSIKLKLMFLLKYNCMYLRYLSGISLIKTFKYSSYSNFENQWMVSFIEMLCRKFYRSARTILFCNIAVRRNYWKILLIHENNQKNKKKEWKMNY